METAAFIAAYLSALIALAEVILRAGDFKKKHKVVTVSKP
jgi:hypothetical protein